MMSAIREPCWAYVPDPPLLQPVPWNGLEIFVSTNDTHLLDFPWTEQQVTSQMNNYSGISKAIPICFPKKCYSKLMCHCYLTNMDCKYHKEYSTKCHDGHATV